VNFYMFTSDFDVIKEVEDAGAKGVLHTYNSYQSNPFIKIAKNILSETKMKHMVAVRPYTISPQYLCTINDTFSEFYTKGNPIQINFITGWIKENEQDAGGILGGINDFSQSQERSQYLIDYVEMLESLDRKIPDYYVSVTNEFTFELAKKYNSKIIIDQSHFQSNKFDLSDKRVMVVVHANTKDGSLKDYQEIKNIIIQLEDAGIDEAIFPSGGQDLERHIVGFIRSFNMNEL